VKATRTGGLWCGKVARILLLIDKFAVAVIAVYGSYTTAGLLAAAFMALLCCVRG
jgi:hypothetical protein